MTTPLEQRVATIEADLYRPGTGLLAAHTASVEHLGSAIDDLSQQQRELRLDVREIRRDVKGLRRDATRTALMLRTILDHFGLAAATDDEIDALLDET